jgi:hypothetical protein
MPLRDLLLADFFFAVFLILASMHGRRFFLEILLIVIFANVYWGWWVPRCEK